MVSSPPPYFPDILCNMLLWLIKLNDYAKNYWTINICSYVRKQFDANENIWAFLGHITEILIISKTKVWGGGQDTQATVSWPPPCIPDRLCDKLPRQFEKGKYLRNIYFAKLLWFYNCSIEDFKTSEAQVWVGVKIPRPRYLDHYPVFLTDCVITYQDNLKKANI